MLLSFVLIFSLQTGCAYHDHVVSFEKHNRSPDLVSPTSSQSNLSSNSFINTRTSSANKEPVYTTLLQLRDTICAERLKANSSGVNDTGNRPAQEISLLQSEERKLRCLPPSQGGLAPSSSSHHGMGSSISSDSIKGRGGGDALTRQPFTQGVGMLVRQQSNGLSDLEEDEDESMTRPQLPVQHVRQRKGKHVRLLVSI